jgi:multiple sugar transport system permease protein
VGVSVERRPETIGRVTKTQQGRRRTAKRILRLLIIYGLLLVFGFVFTVPFLWMLSTSFKTLAQTLRFPPEWIPSPWAFENYPNGWYGAFNFNIFLRNSLAITGNAVLAQMTSSVLIAYAFARIRVPERGVLFAIVLATMMIPPQVTLIPQYILFTKFGWVETWLPLMVPQWTGWPLFIFMLRQFFRTLPADLDDAARIDGCGSLRILWYVLLPNMKPALATVAIFTFVGNWNDFLHPLLYLSRDDNTTLAVGLNMFRGQYRTQFNEMMAVAVLILLPVVLMFFFFQQYFIRGIALTGIKG